METKRKLIPVQEGPWQLLFQPQMTGNYVNDHSLVAAADGSWHLFGITSLLEGINPEHERYFVHGWGSTLLGGLTNEAKTMDHGTRAWAPGVIGHGGRYFMLYGPSPTKLAVSSDLHHWMNHEPELVGEPLEACHRDHMVMQLNEETWLMYAVGVKEGRGCVSVFVSNNMIQWRFVQYALVTEQSAPLRPAWGAVESPFAFKHEGYYYLFITYTDCSKDNYNDTVVFRSSNPYDFGSYDGAGGGLKMITRLFGHGSEVILNQGDGHWYMTTCGWRGMGTPHEGAVSIARLAWKEEGCP
ncbi:beta-fructofuranosidase [Paenibacillus endophyticus]|uniref:Beta-fructofuranosidase n=1 Tax=Paenibacillus endophyticus TaxID=1294268 RepID=A0A7W5C5Q4_9BACL|nr:family 43 glycosylhydrolase [Paenibacillus endophyticus]MBB3151417.1 beta-fructofuranosidase [Paenibacillus endophyticus]